MLNLDWVVAMAEHMVPGMVIEIVERNELPLGIPAHQEPL